jgi:hypothetical protein
MVVILVLVFPYVQKQLKEAKTNAEISETRMVVTGLQIMLTKNYEEDEMSELIRPLGSDLYILTGKGRLQIEKDLGTKVGEIDNISFSSNNSLSGFEYITKKGSAVVFTKDKQIIVKKLY